MKTKFSYNHYYSHTYTYKWPNSCAAMLIPDKLVSSMIIAADSMLSDILKFEQAPHSAAKP